MKMKQKNHTQNEKIRRLEKVATQLYVRVVQLEKAVQELTNPKTRELKPTKIGRLIKRKHQKDLATLSLK